MLLTFVEEFSVKSKRFDNVFPIHFKKFNRSNILIKKNWEEQQKMEECRNTLWENGTRSL